MIKKVVVVNTSRTNLLADTDIFSIQDYMKKGKVKIDVVKMYIFLEWNKIDYSETEDVFYC